MIYCRFLTLVGLFVAFSLSHAQPADCRGAMTRLESNLELYEQLAQSFLQSNDTLEEVYATWAKKLGEQKDTSELAQISKHFENSARALKDARRQNQETLKALSAETATLKALVSQCLAAK